MECKLNVHDGFFFQTVERVPKGIIISVGNVVALSSTECVCVAKLCGHDHIERHLRMICSAAMHTVQSTSAYSETFHISSGIGEGDSP
jgi:hypothetical protein